MCGILQGEEPLEADQLFLAVPGEEFALFLNYQTFSLSALLASDILQMKIETASYIRSSFVPSGGSARALPSPRPKGLSVSMSFPLYSASAYPSLASETSILLSRREEFLLK